MVNDIHDVYTQDPNLINQIVAGKQAQAQIGANQNGPAMAQALRDMKQPQLKAQGHGMSSTAPTIAEAFGNFAMRNKGQTAMNEMQAQSDALRGQTTEGLKAQMLQQQQQTALAQEQKVEAAQAKVAAQQEAATQGNVWQQQAAELQNNRRVAAAETSQLNSIEMEGIRSGRLKSGFNTWIDPSTNKTINAATTVAGQLVDAQGQPISIEGLVPYKDHIAGQGVNAESMKGISAAHKDDVVGAYSGISALSEINQMVSKFTQEDMDALSQPAMQVAIKAATPAEFETYVRNNLRGYSPAVKQYLAKVNEFSTKVRHEFFGSALTKNEQALADAFLPSASGLSIADQLVRIDGMKGTFDKRLDAIDRTYTRNFSSKSPKYTAFKQQGEAKTYTSKELMAMSDEEFDAHEASVMEGK